MAFIDDKTEKLIFKGIRSAKMILFIQFYCNPESPTFDNGTQSYIKVYDTDNLNTGAVESHRMLNRQDIRECIERYKLHLYDNVGFELDWLDINLRDLHRRIKESNLLGSGNREELAVLKVIGDRIGAYTDTKEDSKGITVPLTPDEERITNMVMNEIMAEKKRKEIKKA